jgi:branched-chain amino acid transport system permease protein
VAWVRRFLLLCLVAGSLLGALAATSSAQEPGDDDDEEEASEFARGVLTDRKGTRERGDDEPVEGVEIAVTTVDGEEIDTVTSDEEGRFEVALPGPGTYVAILDTDTLPEGVGLAEGAERREFNVSPNESQGVIYNLGARERSTSSKLDRLPQLLFEGVSLGLLIAITAVGLSLIFGTTGLVNFAHGEQVTWGALVAWWVNVDHGVHLIPATVIALLVGAALGALLDFGLWRRLRNRGMTLTAMMIVSIGLSLAGRNIFLLLFGGTAQPYRDFNIQEGVDVGPITAAPKDFWVIGLSLAALLGVAAVLQRTRIGKAMRAVADNGDLAASSGIDVDRVILMVWAGGSALAAFGGVLFAIQQRTQFDMGFKLLLLMFAGITLGGLGTAYGALVGSFAVGMLIQVSTLFIPTELKNVGALAVLIVVLLVRPQGILGRAERIG